MSHHLRILVEAGVLIREQRGKWAYNRLVPETLDALSTLLASPTGRPTGSDTDDGEGAVLGRTQAGTSWSRRLSTRRRISSRMGRTASMPFPAGSSSTQSSYRVPG